MLNSPVHAEAAPTSRQTQDEGKSRRRAERLTETLSSPCLASQLKASTMNSSKVRVPAGQRRPELNPEASPHWGTGEDTDGRSTQVYYASAQVKPRRYLLGQLIQEVRVHGFQWLFSLPVIELLLVCRFPVH